MKRGVVDDQTSAAPCSLHPMQTQPCPRCAASAAPPFVATNGTRYGPPADAAPAAPAPDLSAEAREFATDVLDPGYPYYGAPELVRKLADTIDRLHELAEAKHQIAGNLLTRAEAAEAECGRLREELESVREELTEAQAALDCYRSEDE